MSAPEMATPRLPHPRRRADDFLLPSTKQLSPLVEPGRYIGVTAAVAKKRYHGTREYLMISFDLFTSAEGLGNGEVPVARGVPGYFNLPGGRRSHYAKLLHLLFPDSGQQRLQASALIGKSLIVEVVTVERGGDGVPLPESFRYSKVSEVVGRV